MVMIDPFNEVFRQLLIAGLVTGKSIHKALWATNQIESAGIQRIWMDVLLPGIGHHIHFRCHRFQGSRLDGGVQRPH